MPNTLQDFLEAGDATAGVLAHARLLLRLARVYQRIAPPYLVPSSRIANYKSGCVVIHATNGATATKLRHLATTLAEGFSQQGIECNGVEVKVRAPENFSSARPATVKPLTTASSRILENLCETLPDSALREAVSTLVHRAAKTR